MERSINKKRFLFLDMKERQVFHPFTTSPPPHTCVQNQAKQKLTDIPQPADKTDWPDEIETVMMPPCKTAKAIQPGTGHGQLLSIVVCASPMALQRGGGIVVKQGRTETGSSERSRRGAERPSPRGGGAFFQNRKPRACHQMMEHSMIAGRSTRTRDMASEMQPDRLT